MAYLFWTEFMPEFLTRVTRRLRWSVAVFCLASGLAVASPFSKWSWFLESLLDGEAELWLRAPGGLVVSFHCAKMLEERQRRISAAISHPMIGRETQDIRMLINGVPLVPEAAICSNSGCYLNTFQLGLSPSLDWLITAARISVLARPAAGAPLVFLGEFDLGSQRQTMRKIAARCDLAG